MALYERYTTGDDYSHDVYGVRRRGQTFTIGNTGANENHHVTSVKLKIWRWGSPGIGTVAIYNVDGDGKPNNSLCSVNYNFDNLGTGIAGTWVEFIFTTHPTLSASTQYAIVVHAPSGNEDNKVFWRMDTSPAYAGGCATYSVDGIIWILEYGFDFMFEEYGTALPLPDLCAWIDSKGGPSGLNILDVFELIDSYLFQTPPTGYSFVPTLQNVFGVIDYFLGFNGDPSTGCAYYG